ncbi:hypothetical protein WEH80_22065 [Actinomycetes bacterium KLBMP 9759]
MDERTASNSTHDLLLALAGRVDDDMLAWARELVAVGDDTRAIELLTASMVAERTVLPVEVRDALVAAGRALRVDLDPSALAPASNEQGTAHTFDSSPQGVEDVAAAVADLPPRLLRDCAVHLSWRLTPAGTAPGPLPHPVVLVEIEDGMQPSDVLAYQLAVALDRAGVNASVEVLTARRARSPYHVAALREALPVIIGDLIDGPSPFAEPRKKPAPPPAASPPPPPPPPPPLREEHPLREDHPLREAHPLREEPPPRDEPEPEPEPPGYEPRTQTRERYEIPHPPEPVEMHEPEPMHEPEEPVAQDEPAQSHEPPVRAAFGNSGRRRLITEEAEPVEPGPRPVPRTVPDAGTPRRTTVTPISRTVLPAPVPLVRRDAATPPQVHPLAPLPKQESPEPTEQLRQSPARRSGESPALAALNDPLSGPLNEPLLDPLLAPRYLDDDPLGVDDADVPPPTTQIDAPVEEPEPAAPEESWAAEWSSGSWAMSEPVEARRTPVGEVDRAPAPERETAEPEHENDWYSRHSFDEPAEAHPQTRPAHEPDVEHAEADDEPEQQAPAAGTPLGLRPESLARLSDADRELLARLQAELIEGRKPRMSRRAGIAGKEQQSSGVPTNGAQANGSPGNNGHAGPRRANPPDLAG